MPWSTRPWLLGKRLFKRLRRAQLSIDVPPEDVDSLLVVSPKAYSPACPPVSTLCSRMNRELIDDPQPGSVILSPSNFGGHDAVRKAR